MATQYNDIVYDTKAGWNLTASTSFSQSYTVGTGLDRLLVIINGNRNARISSATYGGASLSRAKLSTRYDGCETDIWYLVAPATGSNTLAVTFTSGNDRAYLGAVSFFNIDQDDPVNSTYDKYANAGGFTKWVYPTKNNCVIVEGQFNTGLAAGSISGGQTLIKSRTGNDSGGCGYEMDADTAGETIGWTGFETSSTAYSAAQVVFNPSPCDTVNVSDTITISESITAKPTPEVEITDSLEISENTKVNVVSQPTIEDSITISEKVDVTIRSGGDLNISIWKDTVSITDSPEFPGPRDVIKEDIITITEKTTVKLQEAEGDSDTKPTIRVEY